MKVLWICNLVVPGIARKLGLGSIPKEGWVEGLFSRLTEEKKKDPDTPIPDIAFPIDQKTLKQLGGDKNKGYISGECELMGLTIGYYGFLENTVREEVYEPELEDRMRALLEEAQPDIVHCFGAEYSHTLAAARAFNRPDRFLIGIQGILKEYAIRYTAHIPAEVVARRTFRDTIKKDSIYERQQKYFLRGEHEAEAVKLAGHIAGRTAFDRKFAAEVNPNAEYHHAGETLRRDFYSGAWNAKEAERHRIFVSQADYPIKGFHYLLIAVGEILSGNGCSSDDYQDIQIYVAGQSIVGSSSLKEKIKISSYGKYLRDLINYYGLADRVHFLGRLSAGQMKEQYLKSDTFVCCSACENSPNSLGEAMMLQVPIVTSLVGGISSVFTPDEDGFSYEADIDDSLDTVTGRLKDKLLERWESDSLIKGLQSETDRRRCNAGFHARENHNTDKNIKELREIYKKICK